jgi:hypothetical protein
LDDWMDGDEDHGSQDEWMDGMAFIPTAVDMDV